MKRLVFLLLALSMLVPASTALAATPDDAIDDLISQGFYVEPGAVPIDEEALSALVQSARSNGSRFMVAVLDEDPAGGPVTFGDAVIDQVEGTILVLTRAGDVGVVSTEYTRTESDFALDVADERGGDDLTYANNVAGALLFPDDVPAGAITTVAPSTGTDSGGGGGGIFILLGILAVLVLIVVLVVRSNNKKTRQRAEQDIASARSEIKAQLDAMANDILELADRVKLSDNDAAEGHFEAASATYTTAVEQLDAAGDLEALEQLADQVTNATWQIDATEALLDGEPLPDKPKPRDTGRCFFDPTHRGPFEDAELKTSAGTKTVRVCRNDAEKLRRGESPQPRMVEVGGRRIPTATAPRSHGGGGLGGLDLLSILVRGMSSGVPTTWGSSSAATRRRAGRRSTRSGGPGGGLFGGASRSSSVSRRSSSPSRRSSSSSRSRSSSSSRSRTGRRRRR